MTRRKGGTCFRPNSMSPKECPLPEHISQELFHEMKRVLNVSAKTSQELYKKINNMKSEEIVRLFNLYFIDKRKYGQYSAWSVIFALKWSKISPPSVPESNSANCSFSIMEVTDDAPHKLFIKYVPMHVFDVDNPLIDNMNGKFLESIAVKEDKVRPHIMKYVASFASAVVDNGLGYIYDWPIMDMVNVKSFACPFGNLYNKNAFLAMESYISIFEAIDGKCISDAIRSKRIRDVLEGLPDFMESFHLLGLKYGMLHNDLHLGNLFLENGTNKLVMIDYGRLTFPNDVVSKSAITSYEKNETMKHFLEEIALYNDLTADLTKSIKSKDSNIYITHMFDMATLCANLHYEISHVNNAEWEWYDTFITFKIDKYERSNTLIIIPKSKDELITNFIASIQNIQTNVRKFKDAIMAIAEGLFVFAYVLLHHVQPHSILNRKDLTFRLKTLKKSCFCHYYFQFYNINGLDPVTIYDDLKTKLTSHPEKNILNHTMFIQKLIKPSFRTGSIRSNMIGGNESPLYNTEVPIRNNANANENDMINAVIKYSENRIPLSDLKRKHKQPIQLIPENDVKVTKSSIASKTAKPYETNKNAMMHNIMAVMKNVTKPMTNVTAIAAGGKGKKKK